MHSHSRVGMEEQRRKSNTYVSPELRRGTTFRLTGPGCTKPGCAVPLPSCVRGPKFKYSTNPTGVSAAAPRQATILHACVVGISPGCQMMIDNVDISLTSRAHDEMKSFLSRCPV